MVADHDIAPANSSRQRWRVVGVWIASAASLICLVGYVFTLSSGLFVEFPAKRGFFVLAEGVAYVSWHRTRFIDTGPDRQAAYDWVNNESSNVDAVAKLDRRPPPPGKIVWGDDLAGTRKWFQSLDAFVVHVQPGWVSGGIGGGSNVERPFVWQSTDRRDLGLPLLPTGLLLLIPLAVWLVRRHRDQAGYCHACGYDLRATTGRCPECGGDKVESPRRPKRLRAAFGFACLILIGFLIADLARPTAEGRGYLRLSYTERHEHPDGTDHTMAGLAMGTINGNAMLVAARNDVVARRTVRTIEDVARLGQPRLRGSFQMPPAYQRVDRDTGSSFAKRPWHIVRVSLLVALGLASAVAAWCLLPALRYRGHWRRLRRQAVAGRGA